MHIITKTRLRQFWEKYTDAESALRLWATKAKQAKWKNLLDVQADYPSAEKVGNLTVFNIKGNSYRLVTRIEYERQEIYIRPYFLTHEEYSKDLWKKNDSWH